MLWIFENCCGHFENNPDLMKEFIIRLQTSSTFKRFVFIQVVNTSNNVVNVCRKYYIDVLKIETLNFSTLKSVRSTESLI